ncbi:thiamine ABC transporter substrate binding subunit [Maritimibacter sp. HL-12]|uniref:thiamine ABC transporter substrate binding subunit n=1 Tax=Maritimibacter sp. HL-12 TaxID=1162418 RepID=UPI000A0F0069|nr:thiamine ABC transporter substrate binding subunit [Maritimibacter sp. HL-12]SMH37520.1 thiamine transport system substrate-binding protein [Maritimibacter sp. HL-12]
MKALTIAAGLSTLASVAMAETPVLTIYTYDSFVAEWGPGPAVEAAFEETCDCDLQFVSVGDGAEILARLRLEGARSPADIALGLDTNLTAAASETGLFAPAQIDTPALDLPIAWNDDTFIPFDWGWFAFVYDKENVPEPPSSFEDLIASDHSLLIQDPRSSTPGLGLLLWMKSVYGDEAADAWARLNPQIVTVTKGWTEAYGMFLEGEADMVLSYTTSPAYHLIAEDDDSKSAAAFDEGNYLQIEVAAKLASSDQPDLADDFLEFMLSDAFQALIPETNWMYPAVTPEGGLPEGFETLAKPDTSLLYLGDEAREMRDEALAEWLAASAR